VGIDQLDQLIEYCFLDQALLVDGRRELFKVDGAADRFSKLAYEFDVDIGFEEGGANFLEHGIESLRIHNR
jgi:hypothetical protein